MLLDDEKSENPSLLLSQDLLLISSVMTILKLDLQFELIYRCRTWYEMEEVNEQSEPSEQSNLKSVTTLSLDIVFIR